MKYRSTLPLLASLLAIALTGCGSSEPAHEVKPLTTRPAPTQDMTKLTTPEEKIQYIENSKAPDSVKKQAIQQIKDGKL